MSMISAATTLVPANPHQRTDPDEEGAGAAGDADVGQRVPGVRLPPHHRERAHDPGHHGDHAAGEQRHRTRALGEEARLDDRAQEGIGICTYGEICGFGPSPATPAGGWESATVKIEPSGKVTVLTGTCSHGQGEETTFAQIAADELGVDIDDVLVLRGDTAIVPYGIGTFGSRATAIGGTALYFALQEVKESGQ